MKKTIMISLLSTAAMMMFATSADAKSFDDNTDVGVSFKSDEPTTPGDNKPYKDNLSLVWKPSSFEFGQQKAVGGVATFNNTVEGKQYLVVNDDRGDETLSTWDLKAKFSEMKSADGKTKLTSKLVYGLGDLQSYDIGTTIDPETNDFIAPNPATDEGASSLGTLPSDSKVVLGGNTMTLEAGSTTATTVMNKTEATKTKGGYATLIKDVKLVATDAKKNLASGKSFTGQVTWTLDDLQP
ncbi:hypothetical protein DOK67_0001070 [Enterococcus sp. DIV0212c]|uniref:hypothetical protein n=1 Tax=Enterococcus sp. DIV0212c TaxID=2230867 RepID=UPI001A9B2BC3|nr:hypothetical protein [Enterococcus sp. DIV0212c]MBO1352768.1 hypothetical protein [Enterococcus sp. DIV0212c]